MRHPALRLHCYDFPRGSRIQTTSLGLDIEGDSKECGSANFCYRQLILIAERKGMVFHSLGATLAANPKSGTRLLCSEWDQKRLSLNRYLLEYLVTSICPSASLDDRAQLPSNASPLGRSVPFDIGEVLYLSRSTHLLSLEATSN